MADTPTIAAGGRLDIGGVLHHSPGASSAAVRGRPTNGWAYQFGARGGGTAGLPS